MISSQNFNSLIYSLTGPQSPETVLTIRTLADGSVQIGSFFTNKFLIFDNGKFSGGEPSGENDIFEKVILRHGSQVEKVALRVADYKSEYDQGASKECYLGFDRLNSEPKCFDSITSSTIIWLYALK